MNKDKRYKILSLLYSQNPHPKTELIFSSDFELLLSVILSAQANDITVNKITKILFKLANTPERILSLGLHSLTNYIQHVGLYKKKALNIIRTSFLIITKYNGKVPNTRMKLESLPGVGRKTSNIILNTLFRKNTIAVDTHVFRVSNRTNFATGKNTREVEKKLVRVVPNIFKLKIHSWFVLHGRYICTARKIRCNICLISELCEYNKKIF